MLKHLLATVAFVACFTAAADAQDETVLPQVQAPLAAQAELLPVESMGCDQMNAEMMSAGMTMNSQLDREGMIAENEAMQEDMAQQRQQAMGMGVGMGIACSIPGVGMACGAMMAGQIAQAQEGAAESQQRMNRQVGRINDSMAGLDQNRLMSLYERHQAMQCQTPQ